MKKRRYIIQRPECEWDGLTLDEIRYSRALTQTRIEISREILAARAKSIYRGRASGTGAHSMFGRMLSALSWFDYGLMALKVTSRLIGIMRRRK